ncbi:hypothetical protein [Calothrix sp. CCY 0018]|uniref:hypothetical protein n=1 Tax=Calothrix sp. CCY 0018 TaxID=3103864 RepID=UPI0039C6EE26
MNLSNTLTLVESNRSQKIIYPNRNLKIPNTTLSRWRWRHYYWTTYRLPDGTKVMSARQTARLVGQSKADVIDFVQSNNLETIDIKIPSKVIINAITLPTVAIYLQHLLEQYKLEHHRLSLCREEWKEFIDALNFQSQKDFVLPNPCFFKSSSLIKRANPIQIQLDDDITLEVLVLAFGEYRISYAQGLHCIEMNYDWLMENSPKKARMLSKMRISRQAVECRFVTELGIRQVYTFSCNDWLRIWEYFAKKGNKLAITLLKACAEENIPTRVEKVLHW